MTSDAQPVAIDTDLLERLQHERDQHIAALEKLNFKVVFGAAALLAAGAFGAEKLELGSKVGGVVLGVVAVLATCGSAGIAIGLINHWQFRERQAEKASRRIRCLVGTASADEVASAEHDPYDFDGLPRGKWFSWSLAIGGVLLILAALLLATAALFLSVPTTPPG